MSNQFDSANYPKTEPSEIRAGDFVAWKRTDLGDDYDNSLYTLKYAARLEGAGSTEIEITATADGDDYLVEIGQSTTDAYTAGVYHWQAYIVRDSDSERVTVDHGTFEVLPNRDSAQTDPRSHVKKTLDAIEAVIEDRATKDQQSYTINGRTLSRMPIGDLLMFRDRYKLEYDREQQAERIRNGLPRKNKVLVRFNN